MTESGNLPERTIVVRNINGEQEYCKELLTELFSTFGPVVNVVLRSDFAFVEYTHKETVAFALAMLEGVTFNGRPLYLRPKVDEEYFYEYQKRLRQFMTTLRNNPPYLDQFMKPNELNERDTLKRRLQIKSKASEPDFRRLEKRFFDYNKHCHLNSNYNLFLDVTFGSASGGPEERHRFNNQHRYEPYPRDHYRGRDDYRHPMHARPMLPEPSSHFAVQHETHPRQYHGNYRQEHHGYRREYDGQRHYSGDIERRQGNDDHYRTHHQYQPSRHQHPY